MNFAKLPVLSASLPPAPSSVFNLPPVLGEPSTAINPLLQSSWQGKSAIAFIDASVSDYQSLVAGIAPGTEVHLLDSSEDAVTQITNTLLGRHNISSLHIVSHGEAGGLDFGTGKLNLTDLPQYAAQLQSWSKALTDDADLLLYGCNVAEGELGKAFTSILSQLTGADVAASSDLTGSASKGGNWTLEYQTGSIESSLAFAPASMTAYSSTLAINVAVIGTGNAANDVGFTAVRDQLNDDTFFDFTATLVNPTDVDTVAELSAYNVAVIGSFQTFSQLNTTYAPALRTWVEQGGGVVTTGNIAFSNASNADYTAILPIAQNSSSNSGGTPITPNGTPHPITTGVASFTASASGSPQPSTGSTVLGNNNRIVVRSPGLGRSVYLGAVYSNQNNDTTLRSGNADRLLEQAVAWAVVPPSASPSLTVSSNPLAYTENDLATVIDTTATVTDTDSTDFDTGTLTVNYSANGSTDDRLAIRNQGTSTEQIGVLGSNVSYEGTTIGTFTGGTGTTALVVTFNASATATAVSALLQNLTYANVSEAPSTTARTVQFVMTDGDGGTSTPVTKTINVTAVDDTEFVVINTNDSGVGSLRQAVLNANADAGAETIRFAIMGGGVQAINLVTALPDINGQVTIDGYTQSGSAQNTLATGDNAVLNLVLSGNGSETALSGLVLSNGSNGSIIQGLAIQGFANNAITIQNGSSGNTIRGNFIGTNVSGTAAIANGTGIQLASSAANNLLGGSAVGDRNLISGNTNAGIVLAGGNNILQNNYIGTNASGTAAIANGTGIQLASGAGGNLLGGSAVGSRNLISGNTNAGIVLASSSNTLQGNYIGTNVSGTAALANQSDGVQIQSGVTNNTLQSNVISGNGANGISVTNAGSQQVRGNLIGTNATGDAAIGNVGAGILATNSGVMTIGGTTAADRNVISGNGQQGVTIQGGAGPTLQGNYIGTNASGTAAIANQSAGVLLNNVGGSTIKNNLISGNQGNGVSVSGGGGNQFKGNTIGTNAAGDAAIGNLGKGISITNSGGTLIGGTVTADRNLLSGNGQQGIALQDSGGYTLQGNYIGTNASGTAAIANQSEGLLLDNAGGSTIQNNVISGNNATGVLIQNGSNGTQVKGNRIGTDFTGTGTLGNNGTGITITANGNSVGGTNAGDGNIIAFNTSYGVRVNTSTGNQILGNALFANGNLGIELAPDNSVTLNDLGDGDTGSNNLQNFPVLTNVANNTISGFLNSNASRNYRIEFFANTAYDPSGAGEGEVYLGFQSVTTDSSGNANLSFNYTPVNGKPVITATATDLSTSDTSEFSRRNQAPVNTAPATISTNEDTAIVFSGANTIAISDVDTAGTGTMQVTLTATNGTVTLGSITNVTVTGNASATVTLAGSVANINAALSGLSFNPTANYNGTGSIQIATNDQSGTQLGGALSDTDTITITINAVNDAPTAANDSLSAINEDSGVYTIPFANLLGNDSTGPANESSQTLTITNVGSAVGGTVAISGSTILFTPTANFNGNASFQYTVQDNGITNGAADPQTAIAIASFTVNAINDVPSFTKGADQVVNEDTVVQALAWATNVSPGATNEANQTLSFLVSNNNTALFSVQPTIDATGNLSYTPTANASGTATITVQLQDNGGTAIGGSNTSAAQTFTITVNAVNDAPTLTGNATLPAVTQNTTNPSGSTITSLFSSLFSDIDVGASFSGLAIRGNTASAGNEGTWQYSIDGTIWSTIGSVTDGSTALALSASTRLRFVPVTGYNGTPSGLTVRALDNTYSGGFSTNSNRVTVDTTTNGGSSAIANTFASLSTSVTPILPSLVWRNGSTGQNAVWQLNNFSVTSSAFIPSQPDVAWQIVASNADFNQDGFADLLWRNQRTGENSIWELNSTGLQSSYFITPIADLNWQMAGTADLNRDGTPDIIWRNQTSGQNAVWQQRGATLQSFYLLPTVTEAGWQIVATTADFNNDGITDLLWRNQNSGQNVIWQMSPTGYQTGYFFTPVADPNWRIVSTGDFNGDGTGDIVWRNQSSGENAIWQMNGGTLRSSYALTRVADTNWQIAGVADLGGNGTPELLWRNKVAGKAVIWQLNGFSYAATSPLPDLPDPNWSVKPLVLDVKPLAQG